jgi:sulfatase modifying factor 1
MGTDDPDGHPEDAEGPPRDVLVEAFALASTAVTNRDFAAFVADTGHRTDAEREGWSFVFDQLLHPGAASYVMDAWVPATPWWLAVRGASWAAPGGPGSDVQRHLDHPVVHVSVQDAEAYCDWSGTRLPTEAEWEYAARGGLVGRTYPWGDELTPGGDHRCNIWQGEFPRTNTLADGWLGTSPARTYPPNGYGLYDMVGNAWEMCADAWSDATATWPTERVLRGGSYLCHPSYCRRYRVAARTRTTLDASTGNTGFRVAR